MIADSSLGIGLTVSVDVSRPYGNHRNGFVKLCYVSIARFT